MTPASKTILIVSYHFAPSATVGAKRFSFFAREFKRLGYDVHVIAGDKEDQYGEPDASVPIAGNVYRCSEAMKLPLSGSGLWARAVNAILRRVLAPVGWQFFWAPAATRAGLDAVRHLPPGVVIATSPPFAAMIAGSRIARQLGWPLIIDYRDPWSAFAWPAWQRGPIAQWIARHIEGYYVKRSAARVLNTSAIHQWFEKYFPAYTTRNFVIPNGFDPVPAVATPSDDGALEIVHAGTLYAGRTLLPVLEAAANLSRRYAARPIRVINYGDIPPQEHARIVTAGLESFLEVRARIPWARLFSHLQSAHVLLAVVGDHMAYSAPYKIYDYLAAGRPIVALAPPDSALRDFIVHSGAGVCVDSSDRVAIEQALEDSLFGKASSVDRTRVERCLWSNLALQYRAVIDTVLADHVAMPAIGASLGKVPADVKDAQRP